MPSEQIGEYRIEYTGERIRSVNGWGAFMTIYAPSRNPMHRNNIVPHQRTAVVHVFTTEQEAEHRARGAALALLDPAAAAAYAVE